MRKQLLLMITIIISTLMFANTVIANDLPDDIVIQEDVMPETEVTDQEEVKSTDQTEEFWIDGIEAVQNPDVEAVAEETDEPAGIEDEASTIATSSFSSATSITLGTSYSGAITSSNTSSYYKFTLSTSGTVTLTSTAYMTYVYYRIYDQDGTQVWSCKGYWNSSTGQITINKSICLTSGTYYLKMEQLSSCTGEYTFKASFSSSDESFTETNGGSNNSLSTADSISLGKTYKGQIAANDSKDYYKFTLSSSGTVSLTSTAYMQYVYYKLFDESGVQLWYVKNYWNSSTEQCTLSTALSLTAGIYYLEVEQYSSITGDYTFNTTYTSSKESFSETNGGTDNSLVSANSISLNTHYNGQIAINDSKDFYKFTLSSSASITLYSSASMQYLYYRIYNESGSQEWCTKGYWDSSTGKITISKSITLSAGTYYLEMERYSSSCTGDYKFALLLDAGSTSISSLTNKSSGVKIKWSKELLKNNLCNSVRYDIMVLC